MEDAVQPGGKEMTDQQAPIARASLTVEDVHRECGDILDWKLSAILETGATAADLAAAIGWAEGQSELGQEGRPLVGAAAQIYDILLADEEFDEETGDD